MHHHNTRSLKLEEPVFPIHNVETIHFSILTYKYLNTKFHVNLLLQYMVRINILKYKSSAPENFDTKSYSLNHNNFDIAEIVY